MRLPRLSTRRTMVLVAVVAALFWSIVELPRLLRISQTRWERAAQYGRDELYSQILFNQADARVKKSRADAEWLRQYRIPDDFNPRAKSTLQVLELAAGRLGCGERPRVVRWLYQWLAFACEARAKHEAVLARWHALGIRWSARLREKYERGAWQPWRAVSSDPMNPY